MLFRVLFSPQRTNSSPSFSFSRPFSQDEAADAASPLLRRGELDEVLRLEVEAAAAADAAALPAAAGLAKSLGANRLPGVAATVPTIWAMGE